MTSSGCRCCEEQKIRDAVSTALSGLDPGVIVLSAKGPFSPIKRHCFVPCCDFCNSCHHHLCCECFRKGVRVDYAKKRFIYPK